MPSNDDYLHTIRAIRAGDIALLESLLQANPEIASSRLGGLAGGRTPLHVATDWPGFFPHAPRVVGLLIDAGAEVDVRGEDGSGETPLHWTANSDDQAVARVLIDAGADIEAPAGSIGTPLDNAVGYGCWNVARLLLERGARVDKPWHAAALGLLDRLDELVTDSPVTQAALDQAFWHACAGGQRRAAEMLRDLGADLDFTPDYGHGTVLDIASGPGTQRSNLIEWLEQLGVRRAEA